MYLKSDVEYLTSIYGTPLYIYDESNLNDKIKQLQGALGERIHIAYSIKANPNAEIIQFISKHLQYADVVSEGEIAAALSNGFSAANLLYVGPAKTIQEITHAVHLGVINFVCESYDEVKALNKIAEENEKRCNVILRVNPMLSHRKAGIQMTGKSSKFGIDEREILSVTKNSLRTRHVCVIGYHSYIGTQILDVTNILENLEHLMKLTLYCENEAGWIFEYLGFGGGYGIPYFENERPLDFGLLRDGVEKLYKKYPSFMEKRIVSESGRFIAASCGSYIMRVLKIKSSLERDYVITDGGLHQHAAACGIGRFVRRTFPVYIAKPETMTTHSYEITGRLCTSTDSFGYYQSLPKIEEGDMIVIPNSGAYCYNMSPLQFLGFPPPKEVMIKMKEKG